MSFLRSLNTLAQWKLNVINFHAEILGLSRDFAGKSTLEHIPITHDYFCRIVTMALGCSPRMMLAYRWSIVVEMVPEEHARCKNARGTQAYKPPSPDWGHGAVQLSILFVSGWMASSTDDGLPCAANAPWHPHPGIRGSSGLGRNPYFRPLSGRLLQNLWQYFVPQTPD